MKHSEVFDTFLQLFPGYSGSEVVEWFPNGYQSIRIRRVDGSEFIFTFQDSDHWVFETLETFLESLHDRSKCTH